MRNARMLKQQLRALQGNCASAIQNIQSIIALIDEDTESQQSEQETEECTHPFPFLQDMRAMGHTHRFFCTKCRQTINVEETKLLELVNQGSV